MPFPVLPVIIAAGAAALGARKARDHFAEIPPRTGKCSNCGKTGKHTFVASGVNANLGPTAILLGMLGVGVLALVARNVYECEACGHRTLPCRMPGCTGMALSTKFYDHELCGGCSASNDRSKAYQEREAGREAIRDKAKIKEQMMALEKNLQILMAKHAKLEEALKSARGDAAELKKQRDYLARVILEMRQDKDAYTTQLGLVA